MKIQALSRKNLPLILIGLIFLLGAFFRFWGLSSVYQRVDDVPVARSILTIYHGDWRPDPIYFYPIFFNYLVALVMHGLSFLFNLLRIKAEPGLYPFNLDETLFIARMVSALLGSLTILIVYSLAKRWLNLTQALLVTLIFSFSFIHIIYSHQIVLDGPMTFFYLLSFYFCFLILQKGKTIHYLLAGFFAGLAMATKYNGIFILFSIFLAHLFFYWPEKDKLRRLFLSPKIYLAAMITILAFFLGHPFALVRFRSFIRATFLLAKTVNETEWHLQPIIPQTIFEQIKFNKYVLGLVNLYHGEGLLFSLLILMGLIWVILKGKKEHWLLLLSALIYFFGALGFLGFYRYRDLVPLTPFYSFLALFSLSWFPNFRGKRKILKAFLILTLMAVVGYRTLAMTYYLWQDDTTQIASRWMKRNLPERSWIAREWFTPPNPDPNLRLRFSTRPYLFDVDLHPLKKYDYVITSSACSSLFLANQKFYPEWSRTYLDLERQHELIKKFYLCPIEYKNPEIKIYSGRTERRRKLFFWLPQATPLVNPAREFQVVDHSPYEKDINSFFLHGSEKIRRFFISQSNLPIVGIFIQSVEGEGEIYVSSGLSRKKIKLKPEEPVWTIIKPWRIFPFLKPVYRVDLKGSINLKKAKVSLAVDYFNLGLNFFKIGHYREAKAYFQKIGLSDSEKIRNVEIGLFLALCCHHLGEKEEAKKYLKGISDSPEFKRYLSLYQHLEQESLWPRHLKRYAGIDYDLWRSSQGNIIEDELFRIETGQIYEGDFLLNKKGIGPRAGEHNFVIFSPPMELIPGTYQLEIYFYNPTKFIGTIGNISIEFTGASKRVQKKPLLIQSTDERSFSLVSITFNHDHPAERVAFCLEIQSGPALIFDYLKYYPDLKNFLEAKYKLFSPVLSLIQALEN